MSTPAVTPAESASATEVPEQEVTLQERLNAATEAEYKTWVDTGEIPAVKPKEKEIPKPETPPKTETTAASSDKDTSKDTSAAATGETQPPEKKAESATVPEPVTTQKKRKGDARILQLLDQQKQEREAFQRRLDELEGRLAKPIDSTTAKPGSEPGTGAAKTDGVMKAADPEPELGGIDPKTGKPFATVAAWQQAHTAWMRATMTAEIEGRFSKSDEQRAQTEHQREANAELGAKIKAGRKALPADFEKVAFNPDLPLPIGSPADIFIRHSENPAGVLYHLGQHPEILNGFYRYVPGKDDKPGKLTGVFEQLISPLQQTIELAKIEARLSLPASAATVVPAKTSSSASSKELPPPPTVLSARGSAATDAVEEALKKKDFADYERAANERERRPRRG